MLNEFILPGLFELKELNHAFINYYDHHRNQINKNCDIFGIYGNFPHCIWNGESAIFYENTVLSDEITNIYLNVAQSGMSIFLNCTNTEITLNMLEDTYSNIIIDNLFQTNASNHIVINSALLADYLSHKYPNLCQDIGKYNDINPSDKTALDNILNPYSNLFINPQFNNNFELINTFIKKKQLFFTINPSLCISNCKIFNECLLKEHLAQLMFDPRKSKINFCNNWLNNTIFNNIYNSPLYISYELLEEYNKIGITHFIFEYYGNMLDILNEYITFFIQPEYQEQASKEIKEEMWDQYGIYLF